MLELRPNCESCYADLPPDSPDALICSFECTFCSSCANGVLGGRCPNCGGELVARPRRPAEDLIRENSSISGRSCWRLSRASSSAVFGTHRCCLAGCGTRRMRQPPDHRSSRQGLWLELRLLAAGGGVFRRPGRASTGTGSFGQTRRTGRRRLRSGELRDRLPVRAALVQALAHRRRISCGAVSSSAWSSGWSADAARSMKSGPSRYGRQDKTNVPAVAIHAGSSGADLAAAARIVQSGEGPVLFEVSPRHPPRAGAHLLRRGRPRAIGETM